jgi:hypothetical protein
VPLFWAPGSCVETWSRRLTCCAVSSAQKSRRCLLMHSSGALKAAPPSLARTGLALTADRSDDRVRLDDDACRRLLADAGPAGDVAPSG